jgi:hypothetical protein
MLSGLRRLDQVTGVGDGRPANSAHDIAIGRWTMVLELRAFKRSTGDSLVERGRVRAGVFSAVRPAPWACSVGP